MPELAEIELIIKQLKVLKDSTITSINLLGGKVSTNLKDQAKQFDKQLPVSVKNVGSRGKFMWIELWEDDHKVNISYIGFHLGLVGRLRIDTEPITKKYDNILFIFEQKNKQKKSQYYLSFNDYRNFGNVYLMTEMDYIQHIDKIGLPINKLKNWEQFRDIMKKTRKGNKMPISRVLLMQNIISGIGNYMRNEALYVTKLSPHTLKSEMTDDNYKRLFDSLIDVYNWAIKCQVKEVDYNKTGFKVYKQKRDPQGNPVTMEKLAGRSIYWVSKVQK